MLIFIVTSMIIVIFIYIGFLTFFTYKDNPKGQRITIVSERFIAIPFLLASILLLLHALSRLKSSKALASESGMLRPALIWTIIILNLLILVLDIIGGLSINVLLS